MRPSTPEEEKGRRKRRAIIIGIIIVILLAGFVLLSNYEILSGEKKLSISEGELKPRSVSPGENASLKIKASNPTDTNFENLYIQIATRCPKLKISHGDTLASKENEENRLTIQTQPLYSGETTKKYAFDICGNLFSGLNSMTAEIDARILVENKVKDERTFTLKIKE